MTLTHIALRPTTWEQPLHSRGTKSDAGAPPAPTSPPKSSWCWDTSCFCSAFFSGTEGAYSPRQLFLNLCISVLNQEVTLLARLGISSSVRSLINSFRRSPNPVGSFYFYLSREALQELICSFLSSALFFSFLAYTQTPTHTHSKLGEAQSNRSLLQLWLYSRCLPQGHLSGSCWAKGDVFMKSSFKDFEQPSCHICLHYCRATTGPELNRRLPSLHQTNGHSVMIVIIDRNV